jgi:hypothetical protein
MVGSLLVHGTWLLVAPMVRAPRLTDHDVDAVVCAIP